jgi:vacuolar-type H+-ATPase subunit C/Vma6
MLEKSEFGFLLERNLQFGFLSDLTPIFDELDFSYYTKLWESLTQEKASDVKSIKKILAEEISLSNCSRALRLRTYYNYQPGESRPYLIDIKTQKYGRTTAADALDCLTLELDNRADWLDWRRRKFLPREVPGAFWKADPRYFQSAAAVHLFNMARLRFRSNPFALDTLALFIKLKQFEEQILCAISEATRLGMKGADVLSMMGVSA